MSFWKRAVLVAGGLAVWHSWRRNGAEQASPAAFAEGQGAPGNDTQIRDAGPEAMRDPTRRPWTEVDEDGDESFPASDPPGNY